MTDHLTLPTGLAPVVDPLLAWAAETTVIAAALAGVAALLGRSRHLAARPATRHALWLMVLVKLATPPLLAWPWPVPRPALVGVAAPAAIEPPIGADRPPIDPPPSLPADAAAARPLGAAVPAVPAPVREGPLAAAGGRPALRRAGPGMLPGWRAWVALAWVGGGLALAARHARRVVVFRRCLAGAAPAPGWLLAEVGAVGRRLGVKVPPVRVVRRLGTPVLWCLGRPTLLVPERMLATLARDGWPAILAHELAHLRRGDPWVRRLELVAGLAWWWNPLYWLARRRLDFEAELACDAWAVWSAPRARIAYAESLIRICAGLSPAGLPAPALGVVGTGRSFERRLTMILRSRSHHQLATPHFLAATLLAGLALPSWTWAAPVATAGPAVLIAPNVLGTIAPIALEAVPDDPDPNPAFDPDLNLNLDFNFDDDDGKEDDRAEKGAAKEIKAEAGPAKGGEKQRAMLQKEMEALNKQMDALGKEMEAKFGPGSEFARNIEKNFGPGSEFVKNIEKKFGDGSEFAKNIEKEFGEGSDFARNIEKEFGPNSEFIKNIEKNFGPDSEFIKSIEKNFGSDSKFARGMAKSTGAKRADSKTDRSSDNAAKDKGGLKATVELKGKGKTKSVTSTRTESRSQDQAAVDRRASRIDALEARINALMAELKSLKAESANDKADDDADEDDRG